MRVVGVGARQDHVAHPDLADLPDLPDLADLADLADLLVRIAREDIPWEAAEKQEESDAELVAVENDAELAAVKAVIHHFIFADVWEQ